MPIYEYTCKDCETIFEEIVLNQEDIPTCPKCKSIKTSKLISKSRHLSGGTSGNEGISSQGSKSACSGCSGGSCSTCG